MSTKSIVKEYFKSNKEYQVETLSSFIGNIQIPMTLIKQKGVVFILITNGYIDIISGYHKIKAQKDDLIVIQPNKPFSIENATENIEGHILILKGDGVLGSMGSHSLIFNLEFLEPWNNSLYNLKPLPTEFIENLFKRMIWEKKHDNEKLTIINAYVITLMLEINQCYNELTENNRAAVEITRKFKREINNTIDHNISIAEYANRLSISTNHLNKNVKSVLDITASQLLINFKIVEAKYLLMLLDENISEIADKVGYTDLSYFIRFFKKHTQMTPTEYRKRIDFS